LSAENGPADGVPAEEPRIQAAQGVAGRGGRGRKEGPGWDRTSGLAQHERV